MRHAVGILLAVLFATAHARPAPPSPGDGWNAGAADCAAAAPPPLQVRRIDERTFAFRQNPCVSFEATFLYLLDGDDRALLIDSGAIPDAARMPLAEQVRELRAESRSSLPTRIAIAAIAMAVRCSRTGPHRSGGPVGA